MICIEHMGSSLNKPLPVTQTKTKPTETKQTERTKRPELSLQNPLSKQKPHQRQRSIILTCARCATRMRCVAQDRLVKCPCGALVIDHTSEYTRCLGDLPVEWDVKRSSPKSRCL